MYKLCIDIGTTSIKCVLFADRLNAVAKSAYECAETVTGGIYIEQSPIDWWEKTVKVIQDVLRQSQIDASQITAIGVSGQSPTLLPLDKDGKPLTDAIIWLDRRADKEAAELRETIGEEKLHKIAGKRLDAYHISAKILWLKKNRPEVFSKMKMLLQSCAWINYKLTGNYSCNRSDASLTYLYDISKDCWSREIIGVLGIDESILPPIFGGDELIGYVNKNAAAETGLSENTPVIAGYVDAMAASLEAGLLPQGTAFESTGTASMLRVGFDQIKYSPYLSSGIGLRKNTGSLFGEMSGTGVSMKWMRDMLAGGNLGTEKLSYADMDRLVIQNAPSPTSLIYLPYPAGDRSPIWNSNARAVFYGIDLATTAADLIRAVMEGTSFALRDNIETLKKTGIEINRIRSVGGVCASDIWLKIKASVINRPIEIPSVNFGAPAGIAMLTSTVTKEFSSVEDAMQQCVEIKKVVMPEQKWTGHYDEMFRIFKNIYEHTIGDFIDLSKLSKK